MPNDNRPPSTRHSTTLPGYEGTPAELAEAIGNLRYDALAELLGLLAAKVGRDGEKDAERGRRRLAAALRRSSEHLTHAAEEAAEAWRISEPYMRDGNGAQGSTSVA
jgi:hypothetical protein